MIFVPLTILLSVASINNQQLAIVPVTVTKTKEAIKVAAIAGKNGISIQSSNEAALNFYLFDVEGTLVYQTIINKNEKKLVEGLTKGTYLYNAFKNDENIKGGKIILK